MRITPLDARKQDFRRSVRGFDCDEVRAFLATLADEYETVLVDNKQLRERLVAQEDKLGEYRNMERTLRDALMTAERMMADTRESANKEGDLIIQDARLQAKRILEECRLRTEELRRELMGLRQEKETYLARFKSLAEAQIGFVENHRTDFDDLDRRLTDLVDDVLEGMTAPQAEPASAPPRPATVAPPAPPATPSAGPSPDSAAEGAPAPAPEPVPAPPSAADEVDQWRDYVPAASTSRSAASEPAPPASGSAREAAPVASPDRPEPLRGREAAPEPTARQANPWNTGGWRNEESDEAPRAAPSPASARVGPANGDEQDVPGDASRRAGLAALGIPVPPSRPDDEAEQAVASLIEKTQEKKDPAPAVSWDD